MSILEIRSLPGNVELIDAERDAALEQLKVLGRNPQDADPIFTKEVRISVIVQWSLLILYC